MAIKINKEVLIKSTGASSADADKFLPYLNKYMAKFNINTPERVLAFLSQVGHESAGLSTTKEFASGSAYEGRTDLGNIYAGDGVRFKGRGLVQITGRSNYVQAGKELGKDYVNNPEWMERPEDAVLVSAWFWKKYGLNELADGMDIKKPLTDPVNDTVFKKITKRINGAYSGLEQRQNNWEGGQNAVIEFAKKNPVITALGIASLVTLISAVIYYAFNQQKIESGFNQIAIS